MTDYYLNGGAHDNNAIESSNHNIALEKPPAGIWACCLL
jgi:hypothetical protein